MNGTLPIPDGTVRPAALVPKWTPMVVQPTSVGQTEPNLNVLILSKREVIIGRDNTCDYLLNAVEVSRRHARFTFEAGLWYIHDLGSTNGLYVQGVKLTSGDKVALEDQCDVYFGPPDKGHFKYTFHVDFEPALPSSPARLPSPECVDSSDYGSLSTQDYNSPLAGEPWEAEIHRLKVENFLLASQLMQEKDQNRMVWCDLRKNHQSMLDKETKFKKKLREFMKKNNKFKKNSLDVLINKYRTLSLV